MRDIAEDIGKLGFEKFGKFGYVSQTKILPMLAYLEKNQIPATKCRECGTVSFPPRADCPKCRGSEAEWISIDGSSKLVTFTQVYFAPPAFQQDTPYLLGVAELANGLRVFAPISSEVNRAELKPGLKLTLKPVKAGGGLYYELGPQRGPE